MPRANIPAGPLLGLLGLLMGVPALLLARATGRTAALARDRSMRACHLLGIPVATLARAVAVEAALLAALGSVAGVALAAATVALVHSHPWLGFAWFPTSTLVPAADALVIVACLVVGVGVLTGRGLSRTLRAQDGVAVAGPGRPRWLALSALVVGAGGLTGLVVSYLITGHRFDAGLSLLWLYGGAALVALGSIGGLAAALHLWTRAARRVDRGGPVRFLAIRRADWERDQIAASAAGILTVALTGMIAAGALADLQALSPDTPGGDLYAVQGLAGPALQRALVSADRTDPGADTLPMAVQVSVRSAGSGGAGTLTLATCDQLERILTVTGSTSVGRFTDQCAPGRDLLLRGQGRPGSDRIVTDLGASFLGGPTRTVDPLTADLPAGQADAMVYPGDEAGLDDFADAVLASAPTAQFSNASADSYQPVVAPTRRVLLVSAVGGLLTGTLMYLIATLDAQRRQRAASARLVALGGSVRLGSAVDMRAFTYGAGLALVVGLAAGLMAAMNYDIIGQLVTTPGTLGLIVAGLVLVVTAAAVASANLLGRPGSGDPPLEAIHRE